MPSTTTIGRSRDGESGAGAGEGESGVEVERAAVRALQVEEEAGDEDAGDPGVNGFNVQYAEAMRTQE